MTGDTAERIRQTLNGQGEIKLNDGAVKGFDLAAMARNVESAFGLGAKDAQSGQRPRTDFTELYMPIYDHRRRCRHHQGEFEIAIYSSGSIR